MHTRAADAFIDVEAMRLTLQRALHVLTQEEPAAEILPMAKYFAAEGGARVTYAAQHLHGGIGVDLDYPLHRYYLWARQIGIRLGSGTWHLAKLGEMLARPLAGTLVNVQLLVGPVLPKLNVHQRPPLPGQSSSALEMIVPTIPYSRASSGDIQWFRSVSACTFSRG